MRFSMLVFLTFAGPAAGVAFSEDSGEGVEEEVEVDRLGEDAEDAHAQRLVEEVVGEVLGKKDAGGRVLDVAHEADDLEAAELGHMLVEDGDVDGLVLEDVEGLASGADGEGGDALGFEELAHGVLPVALIVGEQHAEAVVGGQVHHGMAHWPRVGTCPRSV